MKAFILAIWILLYCASFYGQSAPVEAVSRLDIEVNQGFGMGIDTREVWTWYQHWSELQLQTRTPF